MPGNFEILSGQPRRREDPHERLTPELKMRHLRNVSASVLQDALDAWGDVWDQLQGSVTHGFMIVPETEAGLRPKCGWPEFLEKLWVVRHHLDYLKMLSEGKE